MKKLLLLSLLSLGAISTLAQDKTINLLEDQNLSNWDFVFNEEAKKPADVYFIKDDVLNVTGEIFGYIYTKEKYDNFKLHVEWAYPKGKGNSGIFFYIIGKADEGEKWPKAIECQLMCENAGNLYLKTSPVGEIKRKNGTVRKKYDSVMKAHPSNEVELGKWNTADIICKDGDIKVYINDLLQSEAKTKEKLGHIGFQSEGSYILFRNVKLEKL